MDLKKLINQHGKLIRFLIVGVSSTVIDATFFHVFVNIYGLSLVIGTIFAFLIAVVNGFTWNKFWTFKDKSSKHKRQFTKFLFVSTGGLLWSILFVYFFVEVLHIYNVLGKLITSAIVVVWNFLLNKYWTFKIKTHKFKEKKSFDLKYSVIIPAYNEEKRLPNTLKKIDQFLKNKNYKYEILVVDDGSSDNTVKVTEKLKIKNLKIIKNPKNKGKGYSVKNGVLNSNGEYILFTDADNSTPIEELDKLEKYTNKYDIIIGSRYCKNAKVKITQPKLRQRIGRLSNIIIRYFLIDGIIDTQCGFKLFKHNVAKKIFPLQKINGWGFDMEILLAGKSMGFKIKEVPVSWYNSEFSRMRPIRDTFKTFLELLFIKVNYWFDGYK